MVWLVIFLSPLLFLGCTRKKKHPGPGKPPQAPPTIYPVQKEEPKTQTPLFESPAPETTAIEKTKSEPEKPPVTPQGVQKKASTTTMKTDDYLEKLFDDLGAVPSQPKLNATQRSEDNIVRRKGMNVSEKNKEKAPNDDQGKTPEDK